MNDLYQIGCISYYFFVIGQPPLSFFQELQYLKKNIFFAISEVG